MVYSDGWELAVLSPYLYIYIYIYIYIVSVKCSISTIAIVFHFGMSEDFNMGDNSVLIDVANIVISMNVLHMPQHYIIPLD